MALATDDIEAILRSYLADEVVCEPVATDPARMACATPLFYTTGDGVTVWIELHGDTFRVSDDGEAFLAIIASKRSDMASADAVALHIGRRWDVEVKGGALVTSSDRNGLGDAVWRVAMVSAQVAQALLRVRHPRAQHERDQYFVHEVELELKRRNVAIKRQTRVRGDSGHYHKATIFIPKANTIVGPINAPAHFNQISSVYTKFGDIAHANGHGHRRVSVVDDRDGTPDEDLMSLLVQVSGIAAWSRRDEWLSTLLV